MMKEIDIEECEDNSCFHFTSIDNLNNISFCGLMSRIGDNAWGIEEKARIFFCKGKSEILHLIDVWIRWTIYRTERYEYIKNAQSEEEFHRLRNEFNQKFVDGFVVTEDAISKALEYIYEYMKNNVFLRIDFVDGVDYNSKDIDTVKKNTPNFVLKKMYGDYSDVTINDMEPWNMHTFVDTTIDPTRIEITTIDGKKDAVSIIKHLYFKYKCDDTFLLDCFIKHVTEEERKNKTLI